MPKVQGDRGQAGTCEENEGKAGEEMTRKEIIAKLMHRKGLEWGSIKRGDKPMFWDKEKQDWIDVEWDNESDDIKQMLLFVADAVIKELKKK